MTRFKPVPKSPNAVSSRADAADRQHFIERLPAVTKERLKEVVLAMPRTKVLAEEDDYLHVQFTTALMRYRDDVEFEFEADGVHVRSASRVGYSDMGANRKRVEVIRTALRG
jgi:uncharacterized protein (DUF1499 family)